MLGALPISPFLAWHTVQVTMLCTMHLH
jgi:hypothetical protein